MTHGSRVTQAKKTNVQYCGDFGCLPDWQWGAERKGNMTTYKDKWFTICNLAGGDLKLFALDRDGQLPASAIRHARKMALGAEFGGEFGEEAYEAFEALERPDWFFHGGG
jgi:hypothetical protein